MPKTQTVKSRYESKYGGGYVSFAQYLAEIMCERKAKILLGEDLPYKFWQTDKWKPYFKNQVFQANKWRKVFNEKVILEVINQNITIFSLNLKSLQEKFKNGEKERQIRNKSQSG